MVVIVSIDGMFDLVVVCVVYKLVVLLQVGIYLGEIEGKDVGLMLLWDIVVIGKWLYLFDYLVLVFILVFSVDGYENSLFYYCINQNGFECQGFCGQVQYFNFNCDYIKVDVLEMCVWLKLWQYWWLDFLIDVYIIDGVDY